MMASAAARFEAESEQAGILYIAGLEPRTKYNVEVDDEELWDTQTDASGTLALQLSPGTKAGVRIKKP